MGCLQFEFEWQDPGSARSEELRATWASLEILVDGKPVTELLDTKTRSIRTAIFLPLYPLAEWIADNWWFLQVEVERPDTKKDKAFERRHCLRWAREGFVLPSLRFVPLGQTVDAQWEPLDVPSAGIRFTTPPSYATLDGDAFTVCLRDFVDAVVARLGESGLTGTTLHDQWSEIENTPPEEAEFCRAAARLGVDPYAVHEQLEREIRDVAHLVRGDLIDEFLSLANSDRLVDQARMLVDASNEIANDDEKVDALGGIRTRAPQLSQGATPREAGYDFARRLRSALGGEAWKSKTLDDLAGHLNIDRFDACVLPSRNGGLLDALTGPNRQNIPKFILSKRRPESQQFAFCRSLFEHLTLPRRCFTPVSRLRTDRQQRNRAFAAEFLAPHAMLRDDLSAAFVGEDEMEDLAVDYGVSAFVIQHQIENHRLARISF